MTNDEAISLLNKITSYCDFTDEYGDMIDSEPYYEAVDLAIKALEQERYKKVLIKDHDAEPITYRGILDTEEGIVYMKNEPLERLKHYGFTIEEVEA